MSPKFEDLEETARIVREKAESVVQPLAPAHIDIYERMGKGEIRYDWRLVAGNNEIVCSSLQGFNSRGDATRAAERAIDLMLLDPEMRQV